MALFLMLGRYSPEAIKSISKDRTEKVVSLIQKNGGKVRNMLALLGRYDLAFIVELPGITEAINTSVAITKLTGIGFATFPGITVEEFDKAIS